MEDPPGQEQGLRLLSLDGGGIRGVSELVVLQELMLKIRTHLGLDYTPKPCEVFDLIGGTSTGGLIAILLGRLHLSVEEALREFGVLGEKIFAKKKAKGHEGTFSATTFETVVKDLLTRHGHNQELGLVEEGDNAVCKVFVTTRSAAALNRPRTFKSYGPFTAGDYPNIKIWQAARATSAAPTFFKRLPLGPLNMEEEFLDGGMGSNNPTKILLEETVRTFGKAKHVACIVSVGCGEPGIIEARNSSFFQRIIPLDVIKALKSMATDCRETAGEMEQKFHRMPGLYFRFNVDQGLQVVGLEEWRKMGDVRATTIDYLSRVGHSVDQAVEVLANGRGVTTCDVESLDSRSIVKPSARQSAANMTEPDRGYIHNVANMDPITRYPASQTELRRDALNAHVNKPPITMLPFNRDRDFVGRQTLLDDILNKLAGFQDRDEHTRIGIVGLGGIGKSQIANETAWRIKDLNPSVHVMWINANRKGQFEKDIRDIAEEAQLDGRNQQEVDARKLVTDWLKSNKSGSWLLILDSADDASFVYSDDHRKLHFTVAESIPQKRGCAVIVTSRSEQAAADLVGQTDHMVNVDIMSESEATTLLRNNLGKVDCSDEEARLLVHALDLIPLAITQAAAYIWTRRRTTSVSQYTKDLGRDDTKFVLLNTSHNDLQRDPSTRHAAIKALEISFQQIRMDRSSSASLLSRMSILDKDGIPVWLFYNGATQTSMALQQDIDILIDFSLVRAGQNQELFELGDNDRVFQMHDVVQSAARFWLIAQGQWLAVYSAVLVALNEHFLWRDGATLSAIEITRCRLLMPHIRIALERRSFLAGEDHTPVLASDDVGTVWRELSSKMSGFASSQSGSPKTRIPTSTRSNEQIIWGNISAAGSARQHNGNVYGDVHYYFNTKQA